MNRFRYILGLVLGIGLVGLGWGLNRGNWDGVRDFRVAVVTDDVLRLISVSPQRKMINIVEVSAPTRLWIPDGLGWYRTEALKKIIFQEKLADKWGRIVFYNFGFVPDRTEIVGKGSDWNDWNILMRDMGPVGWVRYYMATKQMIVRKSEVGETEMKGGEVLDEIMSRDFADGGLLADDIGLTIINESEMSGLAGFISKRLEWAGVSVRANENGDEGVDGCVYKTGEVKMNEVLEKIIKINLGCRVEKHDGDEELFLGESWGKMIKYPSYLL